MMLSISGVDTPYYGDLMEDIWTFRHRQFVEKLGWSGIRKPDGREIDQFDHEEAIHLPIIDGPRIAGYSRLLPTTRPHLLTDIYPEIMQGSVHPVEHDVFEWTRCVGTDDLLAGFDVPASSVVIAGVAEYCLAAGIRALLVETHPRLAHYLVELGWEVQPLHVPVVYEGRPFVAILAYPTAAAVVQTRSVLRIRRQVLSLAQGSVSRLQGSRLPAVAESFPSDGLDVFSRPARQGALIQ